MKKFLSYLPAVCVLAITLVSTVASAETKPTISMGVVVENTTFSYPNTKVHGTVSEVVVTVDSGGKLVDYTQKAGGSIPAFCARSVVPSGRMVVKGRFVWKKVIVLLG